MAALGTHYQGLLNYAVDPAEDIHHRHDPLAGQATLASRLISTPIYASVV
jgi:hypothetical protein